VKGKIKEQEGIEYYMQLPYSILLHEVVDDGEKYWIAEVPELPGCKSHGSSVEEAVKSVEEAKKDWILDSLEKDEEVPVPVERDKYSGKILVRMSRSLHRSLSLMADAERLSLNQLIVTILAKEVGRLSVLNRVEQKIDNMLGNINDVIQERRELSSKLFRISAQPYELEQSFVVGTAPDIGAPVAVGASAFLQGAVSTASPLEELQSCLLLQPSGWGRIAFSSVEAKGEEEVEIEHK